MEEIEQYLDRLPYWDRLDDGERELVRRNSTLRRFERGVQLMGGCSDCLGMIVVLKGCVRAYILSEEGREVTLFRLNTGDPCVLSASCVISQITFETHIVTESPSELLIVNTGIFARLTEQNIYVRCFMYELMTQRFSSVVQVLEDILFRGFDQRLASFLVRESRRTGEPEIRMTHEQIAQNTSSAREVVARMLKRFAADGLVSVRRGSILLLDVPALAELGGQDEM